MACWRGGGGLLAPAALRTERSCCHCRPAPLLRLQAARADALAHYGALLRELHLTPEARWRDYSERVKRDTQVGRGRAAPHAARAVAHPGRPPMRGPPGAPQGRGTNPALERGEAEALFREHVAGLAAAADDAFLDLLDAAVGVGGAQAARA